MKIKPCPFCGNKKVYTLHVQDSNGYNNRFKVICEECNISFECGNGNLKEDIIDAWNKRVE